MNLDCQHVREVMDSYLSEELSVETNHLVLRHVAECRTCAAELNGRRRLRALLSEGLDVAVDADRVRARITRAVDREQHSWQRIARLGAIAAMLVAALVVAFWAAFPVNRWLIARGKGHAVVHAYHGHGEHAGHDHAQHGHAH